MPTGHGEKLTRRMEAAIAALLTQPTLATAAAACGVGEATLFRWLQRPEFRSAYQAARREALAGAIGVLPAAAGDAVATLLRNLTCGQPGVEVRAASVILETAGKWHELVDLEQRLAMLEAQQRPQEGPVAWAV